MPSLPFVSYGYSSSSHVLTVPPTKACLLCTTHAGMDQYIQVHARRHLPSAVPWMSEDRLLRRPMPHSVQASLSGIFLSQSKQFARELLRHLKGQSLGTYLRAGCPPRRCQRHPTSVKGLGSNKTVEST